MGLYKKNIEKQLNSRDTLEKQADKVPVGCYLVTRIFPPSKYPTATLCTPWFRVYIPKQAWSEIRNTLAKDHDSPLYIQWDGTEYELEQDTNLAFGYHGYEKDQWGIRLPDTQMNDCFLTYEELYNNVADTPPEGDTTSTSTPNSEIPF